MKKYHDLSQTKQKDLSRMVNEWARTQNHDLKTVVQYAYHCINELHQNTVLCDNSSISTPLLFHHNVPDSSIITTMSEDGHIFNGYESSASNQAVINNAGVDSIPSPVISNNYGLDLDMRRPVTPPEVRSSNIIPETMTSNDDNSITPLEVKSSNVVPETITSNNNNIIPPIYSEQELNAVGDDSIINTMLLMLKQLCDRQSRILQEQQEKYINAIEWISKHPNEETKTWMGDMYSRQVMAQKKENLKSIPKTDDITEKLISKWYQDITIVLECAPRTIDGKSTAKMAITDDPSKWTRPYEVCVTHLTILLLQLLCDARHEALIDKMRNTTQIANGVTLLNAICDQSIPLHATAVCNVLDQLALCVQENGETAIGYGYCMDEVFKHLQ